MLDKVQEFLVMFVWNLFTIEVGVQFVDLKVFLLDRDV